MELHFGASFFCRKRLTWDYLALVIASKDQIALFVDGKPLWGRTTEDHGRGDGVIFDRFPNKAERLWTTATEAAAARSWCCCISQQNKYLSVFPLSFGSEMRPPFFGLEVIWGRFSRLENVAVILDFRAAFTVAFCRLNGLESSSRLEAVAACTLGIA